MKKVKVERQKAKGKRQKLKAGLIVLAIVLCGINAASTGTAQIASGGAFSLEKSVVAGGGGASSSGAFAVTGTSGQNTVNNNQNGTGFFHQSGFWTFEATNPTAATVSIGGKVLTAKGNGIRNALVTLTDATGRTRTTATGSFGVFRFTEIEIGETYILTVASKRFIFTTPAQVITVHEELSELNFTAEN